MLTLYSYWRSSASYRVRIALELKGLAYRYVSVNLLGNEQSGQSYTDRNPEGLVPLLDDEGLRLSQSVAIMEYLEEKYPEPALMPREVAARGRVRALCQMIACDIHPINNLRVLRYLVGPMAVSPDNKDIWYVHWVRQGLMAVEQRLSESASGLFCQGDDPGMADCLLIPQVANAERMHVDLSGLSRVTEIHARCMALPSFQRAQPSACPDAHA